MHTLEEGYRYTGADAEVIETLARSDAEHHIEQAAGDFNAVADLAERTKADADALRKSIDRLLVKRAALTDGEDLADHHGADAARTTIDADLLSARQKLHGIHFAAELYDEAAKELQVK